MRCGPRFLHTVAFSFSFFILFFTSMKTSCESENLVCFFLFSSTFSPSLTFLFVRDNCHASSVLCFIHVMFTVLGPVFPPRCPFSFFLRCSIQTQSRATLPPAIYNLYLPPPRPPYHVQEASSSPFLSSGQRTFTGHHAILTLPRLPTLTSALRQVFILCVRVGLQDTPDPASYGESVSVEQFPSLKPAGDC